MKIGIFTDVHANLEALDRALEFLDKEHCESLVCLGDAINFGPFPRETVHRLINRSDILFIRGNHDHRYITRFDGFTPRQPGEIEHYRWTQEQLDHDPQILEIMKRWEFSSRAQLNGLSVLYVHYPLKGDGPEFQNVVRAGHVEPFDEWFRGSLADSVFFGHTHRSELREGEKLYANIGAVGAQNHGRAHVAILDVPEEGPPQLNFHRVPYNTLATIDAMRERGVVSAEQLIDMFHRP